MAIDFSSLTGILTSDLGKNTGKDYMIFFLVFLVLIVILRLFKNYVVSYFKKLATKSKTDIDDIIVEFISHIKWTFYIIISFWFSAKTLILPELISTILEYAVIISIVYYTVKGMLKVVDYVVTLQVDKRHREDRKEDTSLIKVLGRLTKAVIWILAILLIISNLGINITSLVAGLGIGGIAIAFALQNILQDLFSSFSIYFDKPFKIGDYITIGEDKGVVKHIGLKSTRIQALQGQEIVISNKELTSTRINNYKLMEKRRIVFNFGLEYSTPLKKVKQAKTIIQNVFKKVKLADLDRTHFHNFGDFSLNYEVVYYLASNDYEEYMDTQQEINFLIKEQFEKAKIEMAFPTQTIFVKK